MWCFTCQHRPLVGGVKGVPGCIKLDHDVDAAVVVRASGALYRPVYDDGRDTRDGVEVVHGYDWAGNTWGDWHRVV